jgi:hypothetical protein
VKLLREQLKNPLSPLEAVVLVDARRFGTVDSTLVLEDATGARLVLEDPPSSFSTRENTLHAAGAFGPGPTAARLWYDPRTRAIYAQALALFAGDRHLRLGL